MEKKYPPSRKKLNDLRKKGEVPRSTDLPGAIVLAVALVSAFLLGGMFVKDLTKFVIVAIELAFFPAASFDPMVGLARVFPLLLLPILLAGIVGTLVNFFNVGPMFSTEAVSPKFERLNPANGFKQMFSAQKLVVVAKGLISIAVLTAAFYLLLRYKVLQLGRMPYAYPSASLVQLGDLLLSALIVAVVMSLVLGVLESQLTKFLFIKRNMMTREEVEREHKESDGNPYIKSRRRQLAIEAMENDAVQNTKTSEMLIVNPTHIAIAIKSEARFGGAPTVIAKGKGPLAAKMREQAQKSGIPIVRDRQLARNLFVDAKVRFPIPDQYIKAVSQALGWVRKMEAFRKQQKAEEQKKTPRAKTDSTPKP